MSNCNPQKTLPWLFIHCLVSRRAAANTVTIWEMATLTNPSMHLSHIPQRTIQNRNGHISVLNGALWDMWQVGCWICAFGHFFVVRQKLVLRCWISWWRHQMETISTLLPLCDENPLVTGSPHKGQWHGALIFSLICASTNGWANIRDACDFRRHRVHHDVTVMFWDDYVNIGMTVAKTIYCRSSLSRRAPSQYKDRPPRYKAPIIKSEAESEIVYSINILGIHCKSIVAHTHKQTRKQSHLFENMIALLYATSCYAKLRYIKSYSIINRKYELLLGLGHETMVCLSMFLLLIIAE